MSSEIRFEKSHLCPSLCDGRASAGTRAIVSSTVLVFDFGVISGALMEGLASPWCGDGAVSGTPSVDFEDVSFPRSCFEENGRLVGRWKAIPKLSRPLGLGFRLWTIDDAWN